MRNAALIVFLLAGLAACAAPGPPLNAPYGEAHRYGYLDERLGPDRFKVTYVGPVYDLPAHPGRQEPAVQAAVAQASELAVLRAAELAERAGAPYFTVDRRETDVDVRHYQDVYYPPYVHHLHHHRYHYYPYGYAHYRYRQYSYRYARGRVTVTIEIAFHDEAAENSFATADTLARLRATYPAGVADNRTPDRS